MEKKNKRRKLLKEDDTSLQICDLPKEVFEKILGYLSYEELCQVGRVCKSWHAIARSPTFWKRVDMKFRPDHRSMSERAVKFAELLPPCVTHLKISFEYAPRPYLYFSDILEKLEKSTPNLQVLFFQHVYMHNNLIGQTFDMDISEFFEYLCEKFLENIRILVLHHCSFSIIQMPYWRRVFIPFFTPKIEILDLSRSSFKNFFCIEMPYLKRIYLAGTIVCDDTYESMRLIVPQLEVLDLEDTEVGPRMFATVRNYGRLLTELYMCFTFVTDEDLTFNDTDIHPLPRLKIMCLRACDVTHKGIASLLKFCQSLKRVCVGDLKGKNKYSKCNLEKVVIINGFEHCNHHYKLNYMRM